MINRFASLLLALGTMIGSPSILLAQQTGYKQTNLTANMSGVANQTDPQLINPWGIAFLPGNPFWVANNRSGTSTLYDAQGNKQQIVVTIPSASVNPCSPGCPTGIVANNSADFNGGAFIFDTDDGIIANWTGANSAVVAFDNSQSGADYKGLALLNNGSANFFWPPTLVAGKSTCLTAPLSPHRFLVRLRIPTFRRDLLHTLSMSSIIRFTSHTRCKMPQSVVRFAAPGSVLWTSSI